MPQKHFILAHDLGTTGNKASLFDTDGTIVVSTFAGYQTAYPRPNWAEQDPTDWQEAVFGSTQRLLAESKVPPEQIAAISFSGHMQGVLAVDADGDIYLSTTGNFSADGLSGADEDVFFFTPSSLGSSTSGTYEEPPPFFNGSAYGLGGNDIFAFDLP